MRQVLIVAVATLGFAGVAAAQQTPVHNNGDYGYSAAATLQNDVRNQDATVEGIDYSTTSSYRATVPAQGGAAATMETAKRQHR